MRINCEKLCKALDTEHAPLGEQCAVAVVVVVELGINSRTLDCQGGPPSPAIYQVCNVGR